MADKSTQILSHICAHIECFSVAVGVAGEDSSDNKVFFFYKSKNLHNALTKKDLYDHFLHCKYETKLLTCEMCSIYIFVS